MQEMTTSLPAAKVISADAPNKVAAVLLDLDGIFMR